MLCQAFEKLPIGFGEQNIFVDWDEDDDLDVIKSTLEGRTCPLLLGTLLVQVASGIKKRSTQKQCENGWHSAG